MKTSPCKYFANKAPEIYTFLADFVFNRIDNQKTANIRAGAEEDNLKKKITNVTKIFVW